MSFVRSLAAGLCLLLLGSAATAVEAKLTAQEIADGWVLLFDGESTFGWTGKAEVKDGGLTIPAGEAVTFAVPLPVGELAIEADGCEFHVKSVGRGPSTKRTLAAGEPSQVVLIRRRTEKGVENIARTVRGTSRSEANTSADGDNVPTAWTLILTGAGQGGRATAVKFMPAADEKLFNGKDLAGWKVFKDEKRSKSAFAVTAAGELSVKNGPGDLQTEKQFDDFLLQLECKTNGTALNSGVFFRCVADQYQNGYELQVQNAFKDSDRTKPADFGTGAIYRRVPARKVVSNDNEWFAMTLVAVGPQFVTWVNGYPVVCWKDDRPANDNPRQGLKTGKGHLSIQGHDPTTDLLFRNLRAVEVK